MNGREAIRRNSITSAGPGDHAAARGQRLRERRHPQVDPVLDAEQLGACRRRARRARRARAPRRPSGGRRSARTARRSRAAARRRPPSRTRRRRRPARRRRRDSARSQRASRADRAGCGGRRASSRGTGSQPSRIEAWSPESAITVSPGAEDRPERAEVGLVAGREHERVLGPEPLGQLPLELEVQVDRAVQEARAGQARCRTG